MKIKSIKIEKLFDIFDYNINIENSENLLMITGPNGFGKTMILNILYSLFNKQLFFFHKLVFKQIDIVLDGSISISVSKAVENEQYKVSFSFIENGQQIDDFKYTSTVEKNIESIIRNYLPFIRRIGDLNWEDRRTGRILSIDGVINEYADQLPEKINKKFFSFSEKADNAIESIKVHLIKEQRLFRKVKRDERGFRDEDSQAYMTETIQEYSQQLQRLITQNIQESFLIAQQLDSTYPTRLISEKGKLSNDDYNSRFKALNEKQEKLKRNGLYDSNQALLDYSDSDSKALLVYLNDLDKKLSVFDVLLAKLELFSSILNERRFTHKSIKIDREKGFYFKTIGDKELSLTDLSSGEQHEVVLLYELIFNANQNTLVLIDEPEISLHITWQKEFLNDLLKIIELQKIQVLIATHSSAIINGRWDIVYNLEEKQ